MDCKFKPDGSEVTGELRFDYHKGPQESCANCAKLSLSTYRVLSPFWISLIQFVQLAIYNKHLTVVNCGVLSFGSTDTELFGESSSPVESDEDAFGSDLTGLAATGEKD